MKLELVNEADAKFTLLGLRFGSQVIVDAGHLKLAFAVSRERIGERALAERIRITNGSAIALHISRLHKSCKGVTIRIGLGRGDVFARFAVKIIGLSINRAAQQRSRRTERQSVSLQTFACSELYCRNGWFPLHH